MKRDSEPEVVKAVTAFHIRPGNHGTLCNKASESQLFEQCRNASSCCFPEGSEKGCVGIPHDKGIELSPSTAGIMMRADLMVLLVAVVVVTTSAKQQNK